MESVVKFILNLFDLCIFWYYLSTFLKKRRIPVPVMASVVISLSLVWTFVNAIEQPLMNLLMLFASLIILMALFRGKLRVQVVMIIIFLAIGMLLEPLGVILLNFMNYEEANGQITKMYFVSAIIGFIRGNIVYLGCKLFRAKKIRISLLPKEIVGVLLLILTAAVVDCCFIIEITLELGTNRSMVMCISIIVSLILNYYFMLYMMERFSKLMTKRHEDILYKEEMQYKEEYYSELEKRNEYVQNLKHNLKNRVSGWYHLLEKEDLDGLKSQLTGLCRELESMDDRIYCANPIVNSVLRIKLGIARKENIRKEISIQIPKKMQLDYGDIGVLYGNLLDNAIEACRKLDEDKRFIKLENKYIDGKLLLVIQNSKQPERNEEMVTTKKDKEMHGRGISSVRKVVKNYEGTAEFTDKGEIFEVSVLLYGIQLLE